MQQTQQKGQLRRARGLQIAATKKGQPIEKSKKRCLLLKEASKQARRKGQLIKKSKRSLPIKATNQKGPIEESKRSVD